MMHYNGDHVMQNSENICDCFSTFRINRDYMHINTFHQKVDSLSSWYNRKIDIIVSSRYPYTRKQKQNHTGTNKGAKDKRIDNKETATQNTAALPFLAVFHVYLSKYLCVRMQ